MTSPLMEQQGAPPAAFGQIVRNEARLTFRQPSGIIVGIGIPLGLLIIFGEISVFRQTSASLGGLILAVILAIAALFTLGLTIAAVAWTPAAARGIMAAALYPLLFLAGLYYPVQLLPGAFQAISHYSPLGAVVQAIQAAMNVGFPPAAPLLVLAGYTLVFGYVSKRFFRWE